MLHITYVGLLNYIIVCNMVQYMEQIYSLILSKHKYICLYYHNSQRGGDIIEPLLSTQWFVKTAGMAAEACAAVEGGHLKIVPSRFETVWYQWLKNPQDWCVSRQLWWGHRIPVYYVREKSNAGFDKDTSRYVVARSIANAIELAEQKFGLKRGSFDVVQEDDVLDTWFR